MRTALFVVLINVFITVVAVVSAVVVVASEVTVVAVAVAVAVIVVVVAVAVAVVVAWYRAFAGFDQDKYFQFILPPLFFSAISLKTIFASTFNELWPHFLRRGFSSRDLD